MTVQSQVGEDKSAFDFSLLISSLPFFSMFLLYLFCHSSWQRATGQIQVILETRNLDRPLSRYDETCNSTCGTRTFAALYSTTFEQPTKAFQ